MEIDQLVTDTFVAHEHLAADEAQVLAAVQGRIAHRHSGPARPLAVAASVAVVAGAAGTAVALSHHGSGRTGQSVHHPAVNQAASNQSSSTRTAHQRPAPERHRATSDTFALRMPYDLGWLPDGSVAYQARRIGIGALSETSPPSLDGEYMLTVTGSTRAVQIDVSQFPGGLVDAAFKSGPGRSVTINGHQGVESTNSGGPGGYELYYLDPAGGLMYVNISAQPGGTVPADQLIAIGHHVASTIHFPGTTQVPPTFGVSYVPDGMQVRGFDVEAGGKGVLANGGGDATTMTSYDFGTTSTQDSGATVAETDLPVTGAPGRPVQGHQTRYTDDHGYRSLSVEGAVDGNAVVISSDQLSSAELYNIANGLVLPS